MQVDNSRFYETKLNPMYAARIVYSLDTIILPDMRQYRGRDASTPMDNAIEPI